MFASSRQLARAAPRRTLLSLACGAAGLLPAVAGGQIIRQAAGPSAANIQPAVDAFRVDLGGGTVAGANGSFGGVRREINWDGVPDQFAAPNLLPLDFFNVNSPRGAVLSTPGTGVQVSADASNPTSTPTDFANIDPSYAGVFEAFSPERLFTAIGSNVVDVRFFVPGTTTSALTRGFGAVFSDVDLLSLSATTVELFGANGGSLGSFALMAGTGNQTFSFFGITYGAPTISRVRLTSGNAALAAGVTDQNGNPRDLVVMDDFIYGEPIGPTAVPEPATVALVGLGLGALAAAARRHRTA